MINESECAFWIVCICYKVRRIHTNTHIIMVELVGWFFSVCQTKLKRILCLNHHERCDIFSAINRPYYFVFWFTWIIKEFVKMLNEFNVAHDFYLCMHLRCSSLSGRLSHCVFFFALASSHQVVTSLRSMCFLAIDQIKPAHIIRFESNLSNVECQNIVKIYRSMMFRMYECLNVCLRACHTILRLRFFLLFFSEKWHQMLHLNIQSCHTNWWIWIHHALIIVLKYEYKKKSWTFSHFFCLKLFDYSIECISEYIQILG